MPVNKLTKDFKISCFVARFTDNTSVLPADISNSCLTTSVYVLLASSSTISVIVLFAAPVSSLLSSPVVQLAVALPVLLAVAP